MAPSRMFAMLALPALALANINFTWVQPTCSPSDTYDHCLKGQSCHNTSCIPDYKAAPALVRTTEKRALLLPHLFARQSTRSDGRCGSGYGNAACNSGYCCSAAGWCGTTDAYCLPSNGCQSGCNNGGSTQKLTNDGTCGAANGGTVCGNWPQGGCCSQYGYCGNTPAHCGTGCQSGCTSAASSPAAAAPPAQSTAAQSTAKVTTDGTCGAANGGTICGNWAQGGCCSQYGWCGNTPAHCGTGCQSGCTSAASSPAAAAPPAQSTAAQSTAKVTTDGTCGAANGGTICGNWPQGGCCSQYGWCGNTPAHCGTGCQSGCSSAASSPAAAATTGKPSAAATSSKAAAASPSSTAKVTTDGSCGAANGGTICGNWPQGNCCSMYGYCGNDSAHCGSGCQSGNCTGPPDIPGPGPVAAPANSNPGGFNIVGQSGVPAMHAGLLPNGKVFFLDKVENYTQLKLSNGQYAYSSEYDPITNTAVALAYKTNAFCSGGIPLADGRYMSVGGNAPLTDIDPTVGNGYQAIRYIQRSPTDPSYDGQAWSEPGNQLSTARWYPTAQIMPDGTIFVASGSLNGNDPNVASNNNPTYEILNQNGISSGTSVSMDILVKNQPYYMYPNIHLMRDGNLFVFVAKSSQIFNVASNTIVQQMPDLDGDYRTYPNTGGSIMLPLSSANSYNPDIIICGGGPYQDISAPTDASCGRIQPLGAATWEMDSMPEGRVMVESVNLLDGTVLWLNGGNQGAQGFGEATKPTLEALIYDPNQPLGSRWSTGASSTIARLYHSVSLMLLDGTVMVAGSNPVQQPILQPSAQNPYVTEFRVEIYTPPNLAGKTNLRPTNVVIGGGVQVQSNFVKNNSTNHRRATAEQSSVLNITPGGNTFNVNFNLPNGNVQGVKVVLYYNGYVTHSTHMGHRMIYLDNTGFVAGSTTQTLTVTPPPNHNITPPGYYVLWIVADGVPSIGQFVMVQ